MSAFRGNPEVAGRGQDVAIDPNVWSGRALQVDFAELAVSGLASMYPVLRHAGPQNGDRHLRKPTAPANH